jgi:hypothetical protein
MHHKLQDVKLLSREMKNKQKRELSYTRIPQPLKTKAKSLEYHLKQSNPIQKPTTKKKTTQHL